MLQVKGGSTMAKALQMQTGGLIDLFEKLQWTAYLRDTTQKKFGDGSCHKCRKRMDLSATTLGFGLQVCMDCRIAVDVGPYQDRARTRVTAAYWDGNLYAASVAEVVSAYPEAFSAMAIRIGGEIGGSA